MCEGFFSEIGENMNNEVAKELLRIKAVFLNVSEPFTWASGIKSPIYCDNRLILSDVQARKIVEKGLSELIKEKYPEVQMLMGTATAGIAHAALCADILELPMGYVRSSNKSHGRQNVIEGRVEPGMKAVVVEDLISTGGSSIEVCEKLKENGVEVLGIVSIFTYGMKKSVENLTKAGIKSFSLCTFDQIIEQAILEGSIEKEAKDRLLQFRDHPEDESWIENIN